MSSNGCCTSALHKYLYLASRKFIIHDAELHTASPPRFLPHGRRDEIGPTFGTACNLRICFHARFFLSISLGRYTGYYSLVLSFGLSAEPEKHSKIMTILPQPYHFALKHWKQANFRAMLSLNDSDVLPQKFKIQCTFICNAPAKIFYHRNEGTLAEAKKLTKK